MNRWVRVARTLIALALLAVLGGAAWASLLAAPELRVAVTNTRSPALAVGAARGDIVTADGHLVATTPAGAATRTYLAGDLYADVVGFLSAAAGAAGLERHYGPELSGTSAALRYTEPVDLLHSSDQLGHLRLTLRHDLQTAAAAVLTQAVADLSMPTAAHAVLVDISSSNVLAMTSTNRPAVGDLAQASDERARHEALSLYWDLRADPTEPLVSAPHQQTYRWRIATPGPSAVPADALTWWSGGVRVGLGEPAVGADGELSAASVAAIIASVINDRVPVNLRTLDAIYTTSPVSQLAADGADRADETLHATVPLTIARTLTQRGGSPANGAAVSAARAALATTLREPGPLGWPTATTASWLSGSVSRGADTEAQRTDDGYFSVAVAPSQQPQLVVVVVAEPLPGTDSVSSQPTALATVTVSVAAALLDAALGRSDR